MTNNTVNKDNLNEGWQMVSHCIMLMLLICTFFGNVTLYSSCYVTLYFKKGQFDQPLVCSRIGRIISGHARSSIWSFMRFWALPKILVTEAKVLKVINNLNLQLTICHTLNFHPLKMLSDSSDIVFYLWVMLTSAVRYWLRIHFRKVLTSLLWKMKKTIKILIVFFFFFFFFP